MNKLTHFAIYTDNIERASTFYQAVFRWQINSIGQPGFLQIKDPGDPEKPMGALQERSYAPVKEKIVGLECSIEVADIGQTAQAVEQAGGCIVMPITEIPFVGKLFKFTDTDGNLLCAIQYA